MQLICVLYLIGIAALIVKAFKKTDRNADERDDDDEVVSYADLSIKIEELAVAKRKIDMINDILLDIQSCSPGKIHRTIVITVRENNHAIDLMTTGDDLTADLITEILENERQCIATSLKKNLRDFKDTV